MFATCGSNSTPLSLHPSFKAVIDMAGYTNLPDIDHDLEDMPAEYRAYLAQQDQFEAAATAPTLDERAPSYHQYGDYWDEKAQYGDVGAMRHRYATPELENQGEREQERSFDGPDEYQSTEGHKEISAAEYAAQERERRRLERLARKNNKLGEKEASEKSLASLASSTDESNPHYGPVPELQTRRNRDRKRIGLTHGNLVIDAPIPSRLASFLPRKESDEFMTMRYTACTSDVSSEPTRV